MPAPGNTAAPTLVSRAATSLSVEVAPPQTGGAPALYRWRWATDVAFVNRDSFSTPIPSATIPDLLPNTRYWIDVRPENSDGYANYSSNLRVRTLVVPRPDAIGFPDVPSRRHPNSFPGRADRFMRFLAAELQTYLAGALDHTDELLDAADAAVADAQAGNASLAAFGGKVFLVTGDGDCISLVDHMASAFATLAQARAGTLDNILMNPLRTKQAIDHFVLDSEVGGPWQQIAEKTANNSAHLTFAEFDASRFTDYRFVFESLRPATDGEDLIVLPSDDGGSNYASGYFDIGGAAGWHRIGTGGGVEECPLPAGATYRSAVSVRYGNISIRYAPEYPSGWQYFEEPGGISRGDYGSSPYSYPTVDDLNTWYACVSAGGPGQSRIIAEDVGGATDEPGVCGDLSLYDLHADKGAMAEARTLWITASGAMTSSLTGTAVEQRAHLAALQRPSADAPLNWLRIQFSSGAIASGSVVLLGRRS